VSENTKFWLVWSDSTGYTRHRHLTKDAAIAEAGRLATGNTDSTFFVLEASCIVRPVKPPVEVVQLIEATAAQIAAASPVVTASTRDGIPF
jgi:hypothetical protein